MPLIPAKIIARIRTEHSGAYGTLTWEWMLRADGRVSYRLSEVSGQRERNPWTEVTQLTPEQVQAARHPGEAETLLTRLAAERGHQRSDAGS
jgi:hypothetical protein